MHDVEDKRHNPGVHAALTLTAAACALAALYAAVVLTSGWAVALAVVTVIVVSQTHRFSSYRPVLANSILLVAALAVVWRVGSTIT